MLSAPTAKLVHRSLKLHTTKALQFSELKMTLLVNNIWT
jgi:hypothetical protein